MAKTMVVGCGNRDQIRMRFDMLRRPWCKLTDESYPEVTERRGELMEEVVAGLFVEYHPVVQTRFPPDQVPGGLSARSERQSLAEP
jgi:hypothetical protein